MQRKVINPWSWQDQFGFVQAVELTGGERTLVCSGQAAQGEDGAPVHAGDMRAQTVRALDNLETVLKEAGFKLSDVVSMKFYTTDVDRFLADGVEAWGRRLAESGCRTTATLLGITRLGFPELLIEFEATAVA